MVDEEWWKVKAGEKTKINKPTDEQREALLDAGFTVTRVITEGSKTKITTYSPLTYAESVKQREILKQIDNFRETCEAMGGKYTEEEGWLEPDVGGDHISEYMARKQWCDLSHLENAPKGLHVFRSPGHVELQSELFTPTARPEFNTYFEESFDRKAQTMCFKTTVPKFSNDVEGVSQFCVQSYPRGQPEAIWIGFPNWGYAKGRVV